MPRIFVEFFALFWIVVEFLLFLRVTLEAFVMMVWGDRALLRLLAVGDFVFLFTLPNLFNIKPPLCDLASSECNES